MSIVSTIIEWNKSFTSGFFKSRRIIFISAQVVTSCAYTFGKAL